MKKEFDNYIVYDDGRIYSKITSKFLSLKPSCGGYVQVTLHLGKEGKRIPFRINMLTDRLIRNIANKRHTVSYDKYEKILTKNQIQIIDTKAKSASTIKIS